MTDTLRKEIEASGFAFLREHRTGVETIRVAKDLGSVVHLPGVSEIQHLSPKHESSSAPNTYSGNYGTREFPLHTDLAHWHLPPRYFILRCIVGTADVLTQLLSCDEIVRTVGSKPLRRALVQPRRPIGFVRPLLRLLEDAPDSPHCFRWDRLFLEPATPASRAICDDVQKALLRMKPYDLALERPGDTLLVDNWRVLHGRSRVATDLAMARRIDRIYLGALR